MRQMYENGASLRDEREAAARLEGAWSCVLNKLPISYHVDFAAVRAGNVVAWVEFKRRHHIFGDYDTIMLSALKWKSGMDLSKATGVPFLFAAQFDCGTIAWVDCSTISPATKYGGRTLATRDSADIEPVVHIPVSSMTVIQPAKAAA